jgi:diketogulonate reductase-like aldo/keto reductase
VFRSSPEDTVAAVESAPACGYRLIDTAAASGNEREVGEAIVRSGIARDAPFVQTTLWISDYGYDSGLRAFDISLRKLGLDSVDLYLLHQRASFRFFSGVTREKSTPLQRPRFVTRH